VARCSGTAWKMEGRGEMTISAGRSHENAHLQAKAKRTALWKAEV
jgi:hypothetical protein